MQELVAKYDRLKTLKHSSSTSFLQTILDKTGGKALISVQMGLNYRTIDILFAQNLEVSKIMSIFAPD